MLSLKVSLKGGEVFLPPKCTIEATLTKRQRKNCHNQPEPKLLEGSSTLLERSYWD